MTITIGIVALEEEVALIAVIEPVTNEAEQRFCEF